MKRLLTLLTILFFAQVAVAEQTQKIAVVDFAELYKTSKVGKYFTDNVNTMKGEFEKSIQSRRDQIRKEQGALEKKRTALSDEAWTKEYKDHNKKIEKYRDELSRNETQFQEKVIKAQTTLNNNILEVIKEVAKNQDFSVVITADAVLFKADNVDITQEVLKKLDKKITKVNFK